LYFFYGFYLFCFLHCHCCLMLSVEYAGKVYTQHSQLINVVDAMTTDNLLYFGRTSGMIQFNIWICVFVRCFLLIYCHLSHA
jgi:hypothetical protein